MGLGSQHDMLNNHFGDLNCEKVTKLSISLLPELKTTIPERDQHQCDFHELNEMLFAECMEEVVMWKQGVEKWEVDMLGTNLHNEISLAVLISSGIWIEEEHSPDIGFYEIFQHLMTMQLILRVQG
ncbi:hypothetical protein EDB19DRAFT_1914408 [Suillus lakei]|nr:hypothetical protein EDB19DRAFT_1914408 [Suillus lakei]